MTRLFVRVGKGLVAVSAVVTVLVSGAGAANAVVAKPADPGPPLEVLAVARPMLGECAGILGGVAMGPEGGLSGPLADYLKVAADTIWTAEGRAQLVKDATSNCVGT